MLTCSFLKIEKHTNVFNFTIFVLIFLLQILTTDSSGELDDSAYGIKRERVRPDTLNVLMKTSKQTDAPTTTASPISPHRRASIHRMRDRYKSQLLAEKKKVEVVARYNK